MRIHILIFLAVILIATHEAAVVKNVLNAFNNAAKGSVLDEKLKSMLEGLKEVMRNGNTTLGIPRLDPFQSDPMSLAVNTEDLLGNITFASLNIEGLSNYNIMNSTLAMVGLKLGISLEWPYITGSLLRYNIPTGRLMNFVNIFGNGNAIFSIKNLRFSIELSIAADKITKFLFIKDLKTSISIGNSGEDGNIEFYTEGLYDDQELSQLFSAVISELAPDAFITYYKDMINELNKFITKEGNKFLHGKTLKDLLALTKPK